MVTSPELYPIQFALLNNVMWSCSLHLHTICPTSRSRGGDWTSETYLRHLCDEGMVGRYGKDASRPEYVKRLEFELSIINEMGFDDYFLIVWDLCKAAEQRDIWWNVRGSGAGSVVAYTLGITTVDPFRNRLMFERFLNPARVTMPDIDLDNPGCGQSFGYSLE